MKTNEEFLQGVYVKRDALVKKRKKRMALTTTTVCAVLCVAAAVTANVFGESGAVKIIKTTEIEQSGFMNRNDKELYSVEMKEEYNVLTDKLQPERATETVTMLAEGEAVFNENGLNVPEIETEFAVESVQDGNLGYDNSGSPPEKVESEENTSAEVEELTVQDGSVITPAVPPEEELKSNASVEGEPAISKPAMPAPLETPDYSTEEIVEAAINAIPEEEREFIIKDSANATVTRYADGKQEYEVYFRTTLDEYWKVKLDSGLNPVKQGVD